MAWQTSCGESINIISWRNLASALSIRRKRWRRAKWQANRNAGWRNISGSQLGAYLKENIVYQYAK
jgi:hypothetical protein